MARMAVFLNPLPPSAVRKFTGGRRKVARRKKVYRRNPTWKRVGAKKGHKSGIAWKRAFHGAMKRGGRMNPANPAWTWLPKKHVARPKRSRLSWRRRTLAGMRGAGMLRNPNWMWAGGANADGVVTSTRYKSHSKWLARMKAGRRKAASKRARLLASRSRRARRSRKTRRVQAATRKGSKTMARKHRRKSRSRKNPIRRVHRRRRSHSRRRNPVVRIHRRRRHRRNPIGALGLFGLGNPRRKSRRHRSRRRNPIHRRRRGSRRRNPLAITRDLKGMISKQSVNTYMYAGLGFVAGGVLPTLIDKLLAKLNVSTGSSQVARVGIGLAAAAVAGIAAKMFLKSDEKARLVTAGAVTGVLGSLVLNQVERFLPGSVSGIGGFGAADDDVRRAIESQVKRELGVGEYVTSDRLMGLGDYTTIDEVVSAPAAAGMGLESSEDIPEVDTFGDADGW